MTRFLSSILFLFVGLSSAFATHLRGGEITYERISGLKYRFTIVTCNDPDGITPEPNLTIDFGDGSDPEEAPLINGPFGGGTFAEAIYQIEHTFTGDGNYLIYSSVENRNDDILNIDNSGDKAACFETLLTINSFVRSYNNSVYFENGICPEIACAGQEYCFNPLAVDPDGDSLAYSLSVPLGYNAPGQGMEDCGPLGYNFPNEIGGGVISIDSRTGTICWNSPSMAGDFVFVVKVEEYYKGRLMGYVVRDIQLTVQGSCINLPPVLEPIPDTCILAGEGFSFNVEASDPDGNFVQLNASGLPFESSNPATFTSISGNPATGVFTWNTTCDDISITPYNYLVTIEAVDASSNPPLSDYETFFVRVIPPEVENLTTTLGGGKVTLNWNQVSCTGALGYNVYRTSGTTAPTSENCCFPGAAGDLGYTLLAFVDDETITTYEDTDLVVGGEYCYTVTAVYEGNVESCPINTDCVIIPKDVPVITHVTVNETGGDAVGIDSVQWSKPTQLDQTFYPGPYEYRVYFGAGDVNAATLIHTTPNEASLDDLDTTHVYTTNTESTTNSFRVELWDIGLNENTGSTNNATSVFLTLTPNDQQMGLSWEENVPWTNTSYEVYRAEAFEGPYVLIGTTTQQSYVDKGLINGKEYCYYVKSIGSYPISSIVSPLENLSQRVCDIPLDLTAPCPPGLVVESDCIDGFNDLTWTNPNNFCEDKDVTHYNVYYSPTEGGEMELIASVNDGNDQNANDTTYFFDLPISVAGCYAVTALDSLKYGNESIMSDTVCVDNCPLYELPNVFTPGSSRDNGDGANDLFHPIYPYRHIDRIEFKVFNRWGQLLFETENPEIGWDGTHQVNGEKVSDGTYYYTCKVFAITLQGVVPYADLHGTITIFNEK